VVLSVSAPEVAKHFARLLVYLFEPQWLQIVCLEQELIGSWVRRCCTRLACVWVWWAQV